MRHLFFAIVMVGALSLAATAAMAGGPPVVNQTDHLINASLVPEAGVICGTGQPTLITGTYSGVVRTLVKADGTVHINGAVRGSAINDDLPDLDGADATTTFTSTFNDIVRASGGEKRQFTLNGAGTTTATEGRFRFHVLIQVLIDNNGDPKADYARKEAARGAAIPSGCLPTRGRTSPGI